MPRNLLGSLAMSLAVLLAAACTPLQWVRQDANPAQLEQDMAQCQQQAWREASWRSFYYPSLGPALIHDVRGRRVLVWPYSPFSDPFGDRFFEESRLTQFCMRAKGYELVPAETIQPSPEGASAGKP
jgi:hypothetical protein